MGILEGKKDVKKSLKRLKIWHCFNEPPYKMSSHTWLANTWLSSRSDLTAVHFGAIFHWCYISQSVLEGHEQLGTQETRTLNRENVTMQEM